jgi:hypothetical protein
MIGSTIALIGIGDLGGWILEFLVRSKGVRKIIVSDIDESWGRLKAFCAMAGASYFGFYPEVDFQKIDLNDIDRTAEILASTRPDVVINCTTLMSWWVRQTLPPEVYKELEVAGSGPWIPLHLTLTRKLMMSVRRADIQTHVVNTCFPDGVNAALGKVGLAPTTGGGNSALLIPGICKKVGEQMTVPPHNISVSLIAHHFHVMSLILNQSMGGAPYFIRIMLGDRDVTKEVNLDKVLVDAVKEFPSGAKAHPLVASSFVKNALGIAHDTGEMIHSPGPCGLPGAWPVRLSGKGAEVVLPQGLNKTQAMKIVEEAQKFDGIERIEENGTIVLTEKAYAVMKEMMGYDCHQFSLDESEGRAKELLSLFKGYQNK